ncbi:MAG: saccharopine dehydrogenase NADP-binding domain-containing protein, partial [Chloroflexota bacterium]
MQKLQPLQSLVENDLTLFQRPYFASMAEITGGISSDKKYQVETLDYFDDYIISGIVGGAKPSTYSASPALWHPYFNNIGIRGAYLCFDLATEETFGKFIDAVIGTQRFLDLSITAPYKHLAYKMLPKSGRNFEFSEEAIFLGAVNHIIIDEKNDLIHGINTDGIGMVSAIQRNQKIAGKKLLLIGAGGAANAIAMECHKEKVELHIANRTVEKAKHFSDSLNYNASELPEVTHSDLDNLEKLLQQSEIVICAVSEGAGLTPAQFELIPKSALCIDVRYGESAAFYHLGKKHNLNAMDGRRMLFGQFE